MRGSFGDQIDLILEKLSFFHRTCSFGNATPAIDAAFEYVIVWEVIVELFHSFVYTDVVFVGINFDFETILGAQN